MKSQIPPSQSSSPYYFSLTRIAVSQICDSVGFKSAKTSALSILTDVAGKYLEAISAAAVAAANTSGRTESNAVDIAAALEYLHSNRGFSGGSDVNLRLSSSGPLIDVMKFVKYSDEIPFAKPLQRQCVEDRYSYICIGSCNSNKNNNNNNIRNHIPKWLPVIPEIGRIESKKSEVRVCLEDVKLEDVVLKTSVEFERRELPIKRRKVIFKMNACNGKRGLVQTRRKNQVCNTTTSSSVVAGGDKKEQVMRKKRKRKIKKQDHH